MDPVSTILPSVIMLLLGMSAAKRLMEVEMLQACHKAYHSGRLNVVAIIQTDSRTEPTIMSAAIILFLLPLALVRETS